MRRKQIIKSKIKNVLLTAIKVGEYEALRDRFNRIQSDFKNYWDEYRQVKKEFGEWYKNLWDGVDEDRYQTDQDYAEEIEYKIMDMEKEMGYEDLKNQELDRAKELINAGIDALLSAPESKRFKPKDLDIIKRTQYIGDKWKPEQLIKLNEFVDLYLRLKLS